MLADELASVVEQIRCALALNGSAQGAKCWCNNHAILDAVASVECFEDISEGKEQMGREPKAYFSLIAAAPPQPGRP